jgi:hypothetical protein
MQRTLVNRVIHALSEITTDLLQHPLPAAQIRHHPTKVRMQKTSSGRTLMTPDEALRVHPEGFEPPTLGSEDRCSIQLSYGCLIAGRNNVLHLRGAEILVGFGGKSSGRGGAG